MKQLAVICHLNPTSYTYLVDLGNCIKPMVVVSSKQKVSNTSENDVEEEKIKHHEQENEDLRSLLQHFDRKAFLNFHTYRESIVIKRV
ncbi:hypothetical protein FH178_11505 [Staphylococcus caprae]|uniref:hypothetical protein n=1 Tax=Staphylococcus caprae TaxID=29380 RepID=UPI001F591EA5|nr:hypothetical protein [Staphylococcus caprae]MCI2955816.1 hypothetical protein [Staphylococcus caprae]